MEATTNSMTILNTIREEGDRKGVPTAHKIGFNYAISILGNFEDFKNGSVVIRCRHRGGESVYFSELVQKGHSVTEIKEIFKKWRRKSWNIAHGGLDPTNSDLEAEWDVFLADGHKINMPIRAGGKMTYDELRAEGKNEAEIKEIFNARRRKHTDLVEGSLRHEIYTQFMKLVANWKPNTYDEGIAAAKFDGHLEDHSGKKNPRPSVRTSFCCLVGRMMTLVRCSHRGSMKVRRDFQKKEERAQQETAWNKQSMKREALKQKMGTDAFNAKKHRDKAASAVRKAAEVTGNAGQELRFLEFRRSAAGRAYDKTMTSAILRRPRHEYGTSSLPKSLGFTSRVILADFIRSNIGKFSNMKIKFDVDPCNIRTTLFQHVAVEGMGVLSLSNTNDFDVVGKTFDITGWYTDLYGNVYVNLDNRRVTCHRKLPKEWAAFERWSGYGVVGNPQIAVSMPTLIKIVPHNISFFGFSKDREMYTIGHTNMSGMQKSVMELEGGIKDKFEKAAEEARAAAATAKKKRGVEARKAWRTMMERKKYNMMPFPTANEESKKSLKAMLAQQLAQGSIDMETFKMGMAALG